MYPYRFQSENKKQHTKTKNMFVTLHPNEYNHLVQIAKSNGLKPTTMSKSIIRKFLDSNPLK